MNYRRIPVVAVTLLSVAATGCSGVMHDSSPSEFGVRLHAAPGFQLGEGQTTVHPTASYARLSFDGGLDHLFEVGAQIRQPLSTLATSRPGLWVGGEAAFAVLRTSGDTFESYSTNGWSATALAGFPVGQSRWGMNLYAGAGISNYGSQGYNLRAGVDLQPWFLKK